MQIEVSKEMRVLFTGSKVLTDLISKVEEDHFPFSTAIVKENKHFEFT